MRGSGLNLGPGGPGQMPKQVVGRRVKMDGGLVGPDGKPIAGQLAPMQDLATRVVSALTVMPSFEDEAKRIEEILSRWPEGKTMSKGHRLNRDLVQMVARWQTEAREPPE